MENLDFSFMCPGASADLDQRHQYNAILWDQIIIIFLFYNETAAHL